MRISERNSSADTNISAEGETEGAPGAGAEIPLQPVVKPFRKAAVPLQPREIHIRADLHLQSTLDCVEVP